MLLNYIRLATFLTATASLSFGQVATLSLSSVSATNGVPVSVALSLSAPTPQPAALQWTINYPATITNVAVSTGPAATQAGKTVQCIANTPGAMLCILVGLNSTGISNGTVATITVTPSSTSAISLTNVLGSTADGQGISVIGSSGTVTVAQSSSASSVFTPIRVNAGGGGYTDSLGQIWAADTGFLNGSTYSVSNTISNSTAPGLYQSERWNSGTLQYRFAVPNGSYNVNLKFAEIYFATAGSRVFNIVFNGQLVQSNFDPFVAAGGQYKAVDRSYTVSVTNGQIAIDLVALVSNPKISAIEITAGSASTFTPIRVNAGGPLYTDPTAITWSTDAAYTSVGATYSTASAIANTTTPVLYQTERWNSSTLHYGFAVPNGSYTVRLKFAEIYFSAPGMRVFNIVVNGQTVEANFDPFVAAGGQNKAIDRSYAVSVTGGQIAIDLVPVVSNPKISAIEITSSSITSSAAGPVITGLTCNSASLPNGASMTCTVSLSAAAPASGASVNVSSSSALLTVPSVLSVNSGATTATFIATAGTIPSSQSATITAALNGSSQSTSILLLSPVDAVPPTVAITNPLAGQTLSGTAALTASASDNVHVAGVQFLIDGQPYGFEVTSAPYSVSLDTTTLSNGAHSLSARARDDAGNTTTSAAVSVTISNGFTPIRVNAGGGGYTDSLGQTWAADTGFLNGSTYSVSNTISNSTAPGLYQSERWNSGTLQYRFAVPNGSYNVNMKFAEIYYATAGSRVFNVVVNGQVVQSNFDPFVAAGGQYKAVDRSYPVSVTNGQIAIDLVPVVGNPKVSGIEVTTGGFSAIRVNAGGGAFTDSFGQNWLADSGYQNGTEYQNFSAIANTTDDALYQTERWNSSTLQYRFAVPNGRYAVVLKFAEVYYFTAGQRVFNIVLNGQTVDPNFDPLAAAGGPLSAIDRTYTVDVSNGQIAIDLVPVIGNPKISAIQISAAPASAAIRVNAGGPSYTDSAGNTWSIDGAYTTDGQAYSAAFPIANTTTPALYQTERWNSGTLHYGFKAANGTYTVRLKFAEIYYSAPGMRVFNVAVNGNTVDANFDIFAAAGGFARAIDRSYTVNVTGGQIGIDLVPVVSNPKISAIEITGP